MSRREIAEVEIDDDWFVSDVQTLEDCEEAYTHLMAACASLECAIEEMESGYRSDESLGRAKAALRWKKLALHLVNSKKGALNAEEKRRAQDAHQSEEVIRRELILSYVASEDPELIRLGQIWANGVIKRREAEPVKECEGQP